MIEVAAPHRPLVAAAVTALIEVYADGTRRNLRALADAVDQSELDSTFKVPLFASLRISASGRNPLSHDQITTLVRGCVLLTGRAVDDPTVGIGLASRLRAHPEYLAAASERYGLTPAETAQILRAEQAPLTQALAVIGHRCEFDDDAVLEAWAGAALKTPDITPTATLTRTGITSIGGTDIGTANELLALLPHASHSRPTPALLELMVNSNELPELQMEASKP